MAISAARAIADFAQKRGISVDNIIPKMSENDVFPYVAAEVAMQAQKEGWARLSLSAKDVYAMAQQDIADAQNTINLLTEHNMLPQMEACEIQEILNEAINETTK